MTLLAPDFLARLEALQVGTRRPLAGFMTGEHRSRRHGTSLDFADYRQYHPGDDFRRIDYHLLARLDVLLLKLYEAEEDLHLRLLLDTSASMGSAGKLACAQRLSAALGFVALTRRDPVSVHTFPLDRPAPRYLGRGAIAPLFQHLEAIEATGVTELAAATADFLARPGPPGVTVVLSDLLTPEWEVALGRLPARGSDVVVVHVLAPDELDPGRAPVAAGDVELVDRETGRRLVVTLSAETLARYREVAGAWATRVRQRCAQVGATYVRVLADEDLEAVLLTAWRRQGVLR